MSELHGLVVRIDAKRCHVEVEGQVHLLTPRGRLFEDKGRVKNPIAVGDYVVVDLDSEEGGAIEAVLPRKSKLARASAGEGTMEQVLVANVDQVLIVSAIVDPLFRPRIVDRILAGAERGGMQARIVLNKLDLEGQRKAKKAEVLAAGGPELVHSSETWRRFYEGLGYPVHLCSAAQGRGIDELRAVLEDKITVFSGLSGVGKSSLLNAIEPGLSLRVGKISGRHREGKHTTTHSSLLRLENGGHVVDTPGIRNFGLFGLERAELATLFREMRPFLGECSYRDCSHTHEPDCAVLAALKRGEIEAFRYESYCDLLSKLG
ncbi:MAG: ribosome small subunit-dependent GTPase A [Planctomycetota bacterium]|nr:MAG: ribosome small subunit-dependent GTPase A [Planctomycetota bacterium]